MMVRKYGNLSEFSYQKKSAKFIIKVKLDCIGVTVYQFLETKVVLNFKKIKKKKLQRLFKKYDLGRQNIETIK